VAVRNGNATRLLPAMLQRIQPQIGHARRFGMTVDAEHAALFAQLVIPKIFHSLRLSRIRVAINLEDEVGTGSGSDRVTIPSISILLSTATRSLPLPVLTPSLPPQVKPATFRTSSL